MKDECSSMDEPHTLLGRMEAETAWKRGDGDSAARIVRANLALEDEREARCFWWVVSAMIVAGCAALVLTVATSVALYFYFY